MIPKNPTHDRSDQANDDQYVIQEGNFSWIITSSCNEGPEDIQLASGVNWFLPEVFAEAMARYPHGTNLSYCFAALTIGRIRQLYPWFMDIDHGKPGDTAHSYTFTMEDARVSDNWTITVQEFNSAKVIQSKSSLH